MEIVITNRQVLEAHPVVAKIVKENTDISITAKWTFGQLFKKLEELIKMLNDSEIEIVKKHATLDENGNIRPAVDAEGKPLPNAWVLANQTKEGKALFDAQYAELMASTNTFLSEKVKLAHLEKSGLTGVELMALEFIIEVG